MSLQNKNLDLLSTKKLVELFLNEEIKSIQSLKSQKASVTKAINEIIKKIQKGGRVIYTGAGTSGRLGVLDASECKPTFSTDSFKAVIAGGKDAITNAKEGSEDNTKQAVRDLKKYNLTKNDIVIGISSSGETPYTLSALKYANKIKTLTIGITSNPNSTLSKVSKIKIVSQVKDEIIAGSSRLKAGTAQKILLNMISSISMIKSGKVYRNFMIDVQPKNNKLRKRAIGIISMVCKVGLNKAKALFKKSKSNTKAAIVMHLKECDLKCANQYLKKSNNNLRKIIG